MHTDGCVMPAQHISAEVIFNILFIKIINMYNRIVLNEPHASVEGLYDEN